MTNLVEPRRTMRTPRTLRTRRTPPNSVLCSTCAPVAGGRRARRQRTGDDGRWTGQSRLIRRRFSGAPHRRRLSTRSRAVRSGSRRGRASPHGPYPSGNPSAQPALEAVFVTPSEGASDQTFRLIVKPDLWASTARIRFANTFGTRPLTLDGAFVGLQTSGGNIAAGTNRPLTFDGGQARIVIPAGAATTAIPCRFRSPQATTSHAWTGASWPSAFMSWARADR